MDEPWKLCYLKDQTQKATNCVITFIWSVQKRQIHWVKDYISDCQGLGWEETVIAFTEMKCSGIRSWWYLHNFVNILKSNELYTLKWWILWCVNYFSIFKNWPSRYWQIHQKYMVNWNEKVKSGTIVEITGKQEKKMQWNYISS